MTITIWLLIGLFAGLIANWFSDKRGFGLGYDVFLGVVGASIAGFGVNSLAASAPATVSPWSFVSSVCGAGFVLAMAASMENSRTRKAPTLRRAKPRSVQR
jgi:uncharacterized membrane protein YeaQ/YmgE (transglycosylase-associated protein family)